MSMEQIKPKMFANFEESKDDPKKKDALSTGQ